MSGFAIENDVSNSRTPPNKKKTQFVPDGDVYKRQVIYSITMLSQISFTVYYYIRFAKPFQWQERKRKGIVRRIEDAAAPPREQITKNRPRMPLHANKPQSLEAIFALFLPYSA